MFIAYTPPKYHFQNVSDWRRKSQLKANHFKLPTPSISVEFDTYSVVNSSFNYPYAINHNWGQLDNKNINTPPMDFIFNYN